MTPELAEHISGLAAPIYAALMQRGSNIELMDKAWQCDARAAALRQAKLLWQEALEAP